MSLKSLQECFIQQLSGSKSAAKFLASLETCGNLLPEQQLAIYQNNVQGALQTSLAQVYPVLRKILGENYFKQLTSDYIKNIPSRHPDLNGYGEFFSGYVYAQCQQRNELNNFPYLGDLVQLEWFYHQAYYASQGSVFDFSAFSQLTEQQQAQSTFQLAPCLKFIRSDYPILSIWQLNQDKSNTQQTLDNKPESCSVFRKNYHIELLAIDLIIFKLLTLVKQGATLDEIVQTDPDNNFAELINQGWITSFKVKHV